MNEWTIVISITIGVAGFGIYALGYHNGYMTAEKHREMFERYIYLMKEKGFHFTNPNIESDVDVQSEGERK